MVRFSIAFLLGTAVLVMPVRAEIAKIMKICTEDSQTKYCPVYLPAFKAPEGWVVERTKTLELNIAMFVPKGRTFDTTPVTIYTGATPLPPQTNLAAWVAKRDENWKAEDTGAVITALSPGNLGAGKRELILHRYDNKQLPRQAVEMVAYFVEKDAEGALYAVRLVVSGVDDKSVNAAMPAFEAMLKNY